MSVWNRVMEEAEREARGRAQQWLVERLTEVSPKPYTIQRVQNWKSRGVPRAEYPAIALALNKTIDWVAGVEVVERVSVDAAQVTVEHLAVVADFLALRPDRQIEIARAIQAEAAEQRATRSESMAGNSRPGQIAEAQSTVVVLGKAVARASRQVSGGLGALKGGFAKKTAATKRKKEK